MNILPFTKILCAFDFDPPSRAALGYAGELAAEFGAELCVLHVLDALDPILGIMTKSEFDASRSSDAALEIRRIVEQDVEKFVEVRPIIKSGDPATEIIRTVRDECPGLIVMATHGRTGLNHAVVGSVAEEVARLAPIPVLTVHQPPPGEDGSDAGTPMAVERQLLVEKYSALGNKNTLPQENSADKRDPRKVREDDFPEPGSDEEKLRFLLHYAVLAPSNRNAQPWKWQLNANNVELYADRTRALPVADPQDRELIIGCGAALYNLRLAIRHFGYHDEVLPFPDTTRPDLLARVSLGSRIQQANKSESELKLFHAILERRTSRVPFEKRELSAWLRQLLKDTARAENAVLRFVGDGERAAVTDLIERGDIKQGQNPEFRAELSRWIRPANYAGDDGIAASELGISESFSHRAPAAIRTFDGGEAQAARDHRLVEDAPSLALLETPDDTPHDWLAAGQALEAVLLRARGEGVSASYFNQPIEAGDLWRELRQELGLSLYPQMLFRLGYAPTDAGSEPSPRRPVSKIVVGRSTCSGAAKGTATCSKCKNCRHTPIGVGLADLTT